MPELPEVEAARRLLERTLVGRRIQGAECAPDEIVLMGGPAQAVTERLEGAAVEGIGRHGKTFWISLEGRGAVCGHLGMSGSVAQVEGEATTAVNYKQNKGGGVGPDGRPKYLKLWLPVEGMAAAMMDPRRLARIWPADEPMTHPKLAGLGPDAYLNLPDAPDFRAALAKRRTPIKALLLNQTFLAGIGNWIADEVLFHAEIAPARHAASLSQSEAERLRMAIHHVLELACRAEADYMKFPMSWLFHSRWGGSKGEQVHDGHRIIRETIGGRTTAWAPDKQK
jgi:formamidopyrimidine-DNA glycosylase